MEDLLDSNSGVISLSSICGVYALHLHYSVIRSKKKTHTHKGEVYRFVQGFYVTPTKPVQYKIIVPASKYRDAVSHSLFNVFSMIPFYFIGSLLIFHSRCIFVSLHTSSGISRALSPNGEHINLGII